MSNDTSSKPDGADNARRASDAVRAARHRLAQAHARGQFGYTLHPENAVGEDAADAIRTIYESGLALSPESIEVLDEASRRADFQELSRAQQQVVQGLVDLVRHGGKPDGQENRDALFASAIELTKRIQSCFAYSVDGYRAVLAAYHGEVQDRDDQPTPEGAWDMAKVASQVDEVDAMATPEGFADNVSPANTTDVDHPVLIDPVTGATQSLHDAIRSVRPVDASDEPADEVPAGLSVGLSRIAEQIDDLVSAVRSGSGVHVTGWPFDGAAAVAAVELDNEVPEGLIEGRYGPYDPRPGAYGPDDPGGADYNPVTGLRDRYNVPAAPKAVTFKQLRNAATALGLDPDTVQELHISARKVSVRELVKTSTGRCVTKGASALRQTYTLEVTR